MFIIQALLNNIKDLQLIDFLLICFILLKTLFISQRRLEINKVSSIINFILQLISFLYLGTLSRNFNIFTVATNINKILETMIPKLIIINAS